MTACAGLHLISLEQAKVFTIFVLPLNSCCNPFLYAILTKQFKKDCVTICKVSVGNFKVTILRGSQTFQKGPIKLRSIFNFFQFPLPPCRPSRSRA